MKKKLVVLPSDPIKAYIDKGFSYNRLAAYYNPNGFFDEVYSITIWGEKGVYEREGITYITCSLKEIKQWIGKIKPDVVRAYGGYYSSDLAQISKIKNIPIVVSVHDTNPELIHESLSYADYMICMSEAVKKAVLGKMAFDDKKIWVMPNRIDETLMKRVQDEEYFSKLNARFPGEKHILHVGRKSEQKNLDTVINALQYLAEGVVAIFVGIGDITQYRELAESVGVANRCYFVESVKNVELPYWYSWCDCFCTPSRWEGFGFVFIEAAACEAPIVTSNIGPMNEYLTDGKNAILIDEYENPLKIAEAINKVFEGGEEIRKMCHEARNVGLSFTKERVNEEEVAIYKEILTKTVRSKKAPFLRRKKWAKRYN